MRSGIIRFLLMIILAVCMCIQASYAEVSAQIAENEWSWEPEGTATFQGTVLYEEEGSGELLLTLEIETDPDDTETGKILFTGLNGKKLTIRQQGSELRWQPGEEKEIRFDGSWFLPSMTGIQKVTIRLKVTDGNGNVLAEQILQKDSDENSAMRIGRLTLPGNPGRITAIVLILAGILWAGAIARVMIHTRKKKRN